MHHVDKYGIGKVVEMALEHVGKDRPIHLSFDVGASSSFAFRSLRACTDARTILQTLSTRLSRRRLAPPCVHLFSLLVLLERGPDPFLLSLQVRGGLTFREGHYICEGASSFLVLSRRARSA